MSISFEEKTLRISRKTKNHMKYIEDYLLDPPWKKQTSRLHHLFKHF